MNLHQLTLVVSICASAASHTQSAEVRLRRTQVDKTTRLSVSLSAAHLKAA